MTVEESDVRMRSTTNYDFRPRYMWGNVEIEYELSVIMRNSRKDRLNNLWIKIKQVIISIKTQVFMHDITQTLQNA